MVPPDTVAFKLFVLLDVPARIPALFPSTILVTPAKSTELYRSTLLVVPPIIPELSFETVFALLPPKTQELTP